ncbi:hypothetical protein P153DRAFT_381554 [Dothidotthia symphoricarpi CBS 119687]|uniref:Transmembrane protein n=1 Tax=Dothidotthia symphoricarpi CBS 119687 TaxID=1392245 RepID=A0A6A6ARG5_9PLEO|nr:uncharacterized protein P153DRAFT_381554 [Dothidotthia symphoricarpi CBS 119687]KAF2133111.1 hypothetical protein P153DRAFT_381554 [Dothidotthia symphoricarpi CBS 119687]
MAHPHTLTIILIASLLPLTTAQTTSPSPSPSPQINNHLSKNTKIGIAYGISATCGAIIISAIVVLLCCVRRRHRMESGLEEAESEGGEGEGEGVVGGKEGETKEVGGT